MTEAESETKVTDPKAAINSERLIQLQDIKGRISSQIGLAKKNKNDISALITEMQNVTLEIKKLTAAQSKITTNKTPKPTNSSTGNPTTDQLAPNREVTPAHFSDVINIESDPPESPCRIIRVENGTHDAQWQQLWNAYTEKNKRCSVYHRFEFKKIIAQSLQQTPHYFAALDQNENIIGILPSVQLKSRLFGNFIVSMPYFNYGGPIGDNITIEEALIQSAISLSKQLKTEHIELRESKMRENYQSKTDKVAMTLALPKTEDALWKKIGSKVRAQIKKSKSYDLKVKIGHQELLDDFYQVFAENMRDLGTPVYDKEFFLQILNCIGSNIETTRCHDEDNMRINSHILVIYTSDGKPVSGGFLISYNDTVEIPWASTLRSANKLNANMLLYWQALSFATNQNFKFFDFGRSSKDAPTFKFKKQWGAQPQQLYWQYWLPEMMELPTINTNNPKYSLAIKIWQTLPVWLTTLIGPFIVKNIP